MIGASIGDIVGSIYEFNNHRSKNFEFFKDECFATDDTIMTLSIAKALLECKGNYENLGDKATYYMHKIGRPYPYCGYGGRFYSWMYSDNPRPYGSFGNGSAMRVSACGIVGNTLEEVKMLSKKVTEITHNHPEGIKGAEATAVAVFLARQGKSKEEIKQYIVENYYALDFSIDEIRDTYQFNEICQDTVPQALECFFESVSFEDAIRNAISIGGDSDTIGAIVGGIAEEYYGVPKKMREEALEYLDQRLLKIVKEFESVYPPKISD